MLFRLGDGHKGGVGLLLQLQYRGIDDGVHLGRTQEDIRQKADGAGLLHRAHEIIPGGFRAAPADDEDGAEQQHRQHARGAEQHGHQAQNKAQYGSPHMLFGAQSIVHLIHQSIKKLVYL